jgi:hypothetical protein
MDNPIVEEVRRHRMEHTRKFGGNLKLICEDLRRIQHASGCKVVRRPPKLLSRNGKVEQPTRDRKLTPAHGTHVGCSASPLGDQRRLDYNNWFSHRRGNRS